MVEYKCDFCGKVIGVADTHCGFCSCNGTVGAWDISINSGRKAKGKYFMNDYNSMLTCDDCIERAKKTPWDEFTTIDDKMASSLMLKALAVTGYFDKVSPMPKIQDSDREELEHGVMEFIEHLHLDVVKTAMEVKKRMSKLNEEDRKQMLKKLDNLVLSELDRLEGLDKAENSTGAEKV